MPTYTGNSGSNTINGGNGNDTINGLGGDDDLSGGNGSDTISGGDGDDEIDGGNGDDDLSGDGGNDAIDGGNGDDAIDGGDGDDVIYGGNGGDALAGGTGNDQLFGENGNDDLIGGAGDDLLDGNNGFDVAYFSGPSGEYSFYAAAGYLHVVHLGGAGADGHDRLIRVERLVFADRVINVGSGNNAPVAADDHVFITEDAGTYSSGAASVKDNDFDFDGDALSVTGGTFVGAYGTLTLNADGTYSYALSAAAQPLAQGQQVTDSFNYTVSDNDGSDTGALVFHIAGANDGPIAHADTASTDENTAILVDVLGNDTDIDNGAILTVTAASAPAGQGTASVIGNQVQFDPGADFDDLAVGDSAVVAISYSISDEHGATSAATLTVTVTGSNDGPAANADTGTTGENVILLVDVLANDADADNGAVLTVTAASAPAGQGSASVVGNQVQFDPGADFDDLGVGDSEVVVVGYSIEDEHGASSSSTLTVTVTGSNDGPVASADTGITSENAVLLSNVVANDTDVDNGAVLTVTTASAPAGQGGASVVGNQVQFDPGGDFDYLAVGESAAVVISYDIEDEHGASSSSTLTITVTGTNDAPTVAAGGTDATGSVTELPNNDPNENAFIHSDSGMVAFDDLDLSDTHSAGFTPQGGGYLGAFALDPVNQAGDTVGWQFTVDDGELDFLDDGETLTQTYTLEIDDGNGGTATQDVTITLTGAADGPQTEWYIDNSAVGSANLGTEADPYASLAAFNAAQGAVGGPQVGHTVFLLAGTGTYAEADGINLLDDQILVGVADGPLRPTIVVTGAGNDGIELAANNTISGLDIGDTADAGIVDGNGSVGTLTISDVGKSGIGQIVDIDQGGTLDVTLNSAESLGSNDGAIDLAGVGGSFTVTGATTITGIHSDGGVDITGSSVAASFLGGGTVSTNNAAGVNFVGNTGSLTLAGGLDIVTTTGTGLNATGGGTLTVTGAGNSIGALFGTALNIVDTGIGGAGATFESISAGGGVNGIVLANTGSAGGLTVTGDGGSANNGSGGTIQNTTGDGILLTNTAHVVLDQIQVSASGGNGIHGSDVTNFVLTHSTLTDNGNGSLPGSEEGNLRFDNLLGSAAIAGNAISGGYSENIRVVNTGGSLDSLDVTDNAFGLLHATGGDDNLHFEVTDAAVLTLDVSDNTFAGTRGDFIDVIANLDATLAVAIRDNDMNNGQATIAGGGAGVSIRSGSGGNASAATTTFDIAGNTIDDGGANAFDTVGIVVAKGEDNGTLEGTISGNTLVAQSGSFSDGIFVASAGGGSTTVLIEGNSVSEFGNAGIHLQNGGGSTTMNASLFGNTVGGAGVFALAALFAENGTTGTDTATMNLVVGSATDPAAENLLEADEVTFFVDVILSNFGNDTLFNLSRNGSLATTPDVVIQDDNVGDPSVDWSSFGSGSITLVDTLPTTPAMLGFLLATDPLATGDVIV